MARNIGLFEGISEARTIIGVIAAENETLKDVDYPTANAIGCRGFETIFVGIEILDGSSPTATIEALFRDGEADDGFRWKRLLFGARDGITPIAAPAAEDTGALAQNSDFVELRVAGHPMVYLRVKAVDNAAGTTAMKIFAVPGKRR